MTKETPSKVSCALTPDMVFEEDQILLSFFEKYEADEEDLLKQDVIKYVGTGHFGEKITEEMTTGESLEDVSRQLQAVFLLNFRCQVLRTRRLI